MALETSNDCKDDEDATHRWNRGGRVQPNEREQLILCSITGRSCLLIPGVRLRSEGRFIATIGRKLLGLSQ